MFLRRLGGVIDLDKLAYHKELARNVLSDRAAARGVRAFLQGETPGPDYRVRWGSIQTACAGAPQTIDDICQPSSEQYIFEGPIRIQCIGLPDGGDGG